MRFFFVIFLCSGIWALSPDCDAIRLEVELYRALSPSGFVHQSDLKYCNILKLNGLSIDDYFQTESDAVLAMIPLAISYQVTHPLLLNYMVQNKRWDLLLLTLDTMRNADSYIKVDTLKQLLYQTMPQFIHVELHEIFNFFSPAEKITIAQQLIPYTKKKLLKFKRHHSVLYQFWPLFDQMIIAYHIRTLFPNKFDSLIEYWDKQLVLTRDKNANESSFLLLRHLLNHEWDAKPDETVNKSLKAYYYLVANRFQDASNLFLNSDTLIFFNVLRYFNFFSKQQQEFLLTLPISFTLSDIQFILNELVLVIEKDNFRDWIWKLAIEQSFNCDELLRDPYAALQTLPKIYWDKKTVLSPITAAIQQNKKKVSPYFYQKELLFQSEEYRQFKNLPPTRQTHVLKVMLDEMRPIKLSHWMLMAPHVSMHQHLDVLDKFPYLQQIPTKNRSDWNRFIQPKLAQIKNKK